MKKSVTKKKLHGTKHLIHLKQKHMKTLQKTHEIGRVAWITFSLFILMNIPSYILTDGYSDLRIGLGGGIFFTCFLISVQIAWFSVWMILQIAIHDYLRTGKPLDLFCLQYVGKRKMKSFFRIWFFFLPLWKIQRNIELMNGELVSYSNENYVGQFFKIEKGNAIQTTKPI